ncbi:AraC-like DNA-binding protein/quercetin dioxygenase-like cupin family protein [Rhodococcus sp. 27YEA15]|uniref:helix-turn-helix transcriptional regulator n=1 Tax=Rhodococcus sp. 27YEA15 TaxID=3156259 RepID=UPI003C7BBDDE
MPIPALRECDDAVPATDHFPPADAERAVPPPFRLTTKVVETEHVTRWPTHAHVEHELIWSDRGVVNMIIDHQLWTVTPGVGLWIPRGILHEGQANPHVAFRATLFAPELWTRIWSEPCIVTLSEAVRVLLLHLARNPMPTDQRLRAQQVCIDLLTPAPASHFEVPIPRDPRIRVLVDGVVSDPADDRSLDQWAHVLNVSRRTVTRIFAAELAMSFAQWRTLIRMNSALGMLGNGMSVNSVGRRVGYRTSSSFIAAFRKTVGHTPGSWPVADI